MKRIRRAVLVLPMLLAPLCAAPALAAVGDWVAGDHVRMRLVASGLDLDGQLDAAIEIDLDAGWHTYWVNPGEAGIPPVIDFSESANIGMVSIDFPVPRRWSDGQIVSNIYEGRVVLPLKVPVEEAARPVRLAVRLELGVCEAICIPVTLSGAIEVRPGMTDLAAARILAAAAAGLPGPARPGAFAVDGLTATEVKPGVYRLRARVSVPDPDDAELFVAGPEGWLVGLPERSGAGAGPAFSFVVEPYPAGRPAGAAFVLLLVSGGKAVSQTIRLDD